MSTIYHDKFYEYFHGCMSSTRAKLVDALYYGQVDGWSITQSGTTGQVTATWTRTVPIPQAHIEVSGSPYKPGDITTQSVELCFTGRETLSILLRVYLGSHCPPCNYCDTTMAKATAALLNPGELL